MNRTALFAALVLFATAGFACERAETGADDGNDASATAEQPGSSSPNSDAGRASESRPRKLVRPKDAWIDDRVQEARERLSKSKAGRILLGSIEAHGGLGTWYGNGPVAFHYDYRPVDGEGRRNTFQVVDTWGARARHETMPDREHAYGWDGEQAWYSPADWEPPYDVRFWALTPYYFVGMPFVLADPGVRIEYEKKAELEGTSYHVLRATFGEVGISPDDYYVLYIHPETHRLRALRYIVSYEKFFPEGGHSPPKLMTYDGKRTVDGIVFAESYRFYMWDPDRKMEADVVTRTTLSDVEFRPDLKDPYFAMPDEAFVYGEEGSADQSSSE